MVRVSRRGAWPLSSPALPPSPHLQSASLSVGDHEPALCCLCHAVALCAAALAFARAWHLHVSRATRASAASPILVSLHLQRASLLVDGMHFVLPVSCGGALRSGPRA